MIKKLTAKTVEEDPALQKRDFISQIIQKKTRSPKTAAKLAITDTGGGSKNIYMGRVRPKVQPLIAYPFIHHFLRRYPFRIPFIAKQYPCHIPCLELCIPLPRLLNRNRSQKQNVFSTLQSHKNHLLALSQTQMTDVPTLSYTSTSKIPTLSYT